MAHRLGPTQAIVIAKWQKYQRWRKRSKLWSESSFLRRLHLMSQTKDAVFWTGTSGKRRVLLIYASLGVLGVTRQFIVNSLLIGKSKKRPCWGTGVNYPYPRLKFRRQLILFLEITEVVTLIVIMPKKYLRLSRIPTKTLRDSDHFSRFFILFLLCTLWKIVLSACGVVWWLKQGLTDEIEEFQ